MPNATMLRRHADGALDIGYYRRRAQRLRRFAQRRAWCAAYDLLRAAVARVSAAAALAARPASSRLAFAAVLAASGAG
jgi:hypothetical protein